MRPAALIRWTCAVGLMALVGTANAFLFGEPPKPYCEHPDPSLAIRCPEAHELDRAGADQVAWALSVHRFDRVEADFDRWCTTGARRRDGEWTLIAFGRGVKAIHREGTDKWSAMMAAWQEAYPTSTAARLARALGTLGSVRVARDAAGLAATAEGRQLDREAGTRAWAKLKPLVKVGARACPAVHEVALQALSAMRAAPDIVWPIYRSAVRQAPTYLPLHRLMAELAGRWVGKNVDGFTKFVDEADQILRKRGESGLYARLHGYTTLQKRVHAVMASAPDSRAAARADVDAHWSRLAASYEALVKQWPESNGIRNAFAGAACLARDADRYLRLRDELQAYRKWLTFPESVDVCDLRFGYLPPQLRPGR